jgi:hypothetical protein
MTEMPGGFAIEGVYVYPAGEPFTYYVLPMAASAELDPGGNPALLLVPTGTGGLLQLGARLAMEDAALERVRQRLAEQQASEDRALVRLSPAPLQVDAARLMIATSDANWTELARSATSGYPPYNAVFAVQLTSHQCAAAIAAVQGREDFLQVVYDVWLEDMPLSRVTDIATWFPPGESSAHILLAAGKQTD